MNSFLQKELGLEFYKAKTADDKAILRSFLDDAVEHALRNTVGKDRSGWYKDNKKIYDWMCKELQL
jgi:hypothetical protein